MRSRSRPDGASALILAGLSALALALAGCSTGPSYYPTGSLAPRPETGMVRDGQRTYPDGSYRQSYSYPPPDRAGAYPQRQYTDPGAPTPRGYQGQTGYNGGGNGYGTSGMETGSVSPRTPAGASTPGTYNDDPNARWRQTPPDRWRQSYPPPQRAPLTTGSIAASPRVVTVREGDTLYSLSRQHGIPVADLMAANRLPNERIAIGQQLTIPIRYR